MLATIGSILFLYSYIRIFNLGHVRFRIAVIAVMVLVGSYKTSALLATFSECTQIARSWNKSMPRAGMKKAKSFFANTALHAATDLLIMGLPIPIIIYATVDVKEKACIGSDFACGIDVSACGNSLSTPDHA